MGESATGLQVSTAVSSKHSKPRYHTNRKGNEKSLKVLQKTTMKKFGIVTTRKLSWGKVIFSVACVKNSVHRGEYLGRYTPQAGTPPGQVHPPWADTPPQAGTPPRAGIPPRAVHAGRYGQQAGGTHPTGMHSCLMMLAKSVAYLHVVALTSVKIDKKIAVPSVRL